MSREDGKVPHYMEPTAVSMLRESCNRERYTKFLLKFTSEKQNGSGAEIRAIKGGARINKERKESCCEDMEGFPVADEYMEEVELFLKYPSAMFRLPFRQDMKHLKTDSCQATRTTFDRELSKNMKSEAIRNQSNPPELLPPLVAPEGSTREASSSRSTTKGKKHQSSIIKSTSTRGDENHPTKHQPDGSQLSPNSSSIESESSGVNQTASHSRQNQSLKSSSSLGSLPQINSYFKFPFVSKTTAKLPCLQKVPEVRSSFSTRKIHRLEREGVNCLKCSTKALDGNPLKPSGDGLEQKENLKATINPLSDESPSSPLDRKFCKEESTTEWKRNEQTTTALATDDRQIQKRLFSDHTFSSMQKIPSKRCPPDPRFKTFPSKRLFHCDSKYLIGEALTRTHKNIEAVYTRNHHHHHHRHHHHQQQQQQQQQLYHHQQQQQQPLHPAINKRHLSNQLGSTKIYSQSWGTLKEQTNLDEESWRRERISEWVTCVNEVGQRPPSTEEFRDHVPQTAFLVIHQDDNDSVFY